MLEAACEGRQARFWPGSTNPKGSRRKRYFLSGPTTKRGEGGVNGRTTKEKNLFLSLKKVPKTKMTTKLERGGVEGQTTMEK